MTTYGESEKQGDLFRTPVAHVETTAENKPKDEALTTETAKPPEKKQEILSVSIEEIVEHMTDPNITLTRCNDIALPSNIETQEQLDSAKDEEESSSFCNERITRGHRYSLGLPNLHRIIIPIPALPHIKIIYFSKGLEYFVGIGNFKHGTALYIRRTHVANSREAYTIMQNVQQTCDMLIKKKTK